ncbi:MAG TPA: hypothetical protein VGM36_03275 [Rhizomicrobium sp.]
MVIAQDVSGAVRTASRAWLGPLIVVLAAVVAWAWHGALPLNHDVAWVWEGAVRLMHGARFGSGVDEVNPPLAWWLTEMPAAFSQATGLPPSISFCGFVAIAGAVSILIALRMMPAQMPRSNLVLFAAFSAWAFLFMPGYDFGQREHLMAMMALPYLCAAASRAKGESAAPPLRLVAGILAGIGFCLKPYFLFIPLLVEIWLWSRARRLRFLRIETVTMALAGVVYLLAVIACAPDYLALVVPKAAVGYGAYQAAFFDVAFQLLLKLAPIAFGVGLVAFANVPRGLSLTAQSFLVAAASAALAYFIQSKGWAYQMYPVIAFASVAAALQDAPGKSLISAAGMAIVLLSGSQNAYLQIVDADGTRARVAALSTDFHHHSVFAFITSPRDIHPAVVESGATWRAPACCLYLLPAAVEGRSAAAIVAGKQQAQEQVSRLIRNAPDVVVVDDNRFKLGFGARTFDYLAYFQNDPRFAHFWRGYHEVSRIENFRVFRRGEPPGKS